MVLFVSGVASSPENISQIILKGLFQIFFLGCAMIEPAVDTLGTCTASKVHTEISRALLLKLVSFGVPSVYLRVAFEQRRGLLDLLISVGEILFIPYVVVIVPLDVRCVLLGLLHLPPARPTHPLLHLMILEQLEYPIFLFLFLSLLSDYLLSQPLYLLLPLFFLLLRLPALRRLSPDGTPIQLRVHGHHVLLLQLLYLCLLPPVLLASSLLSPLFLLRRHCLIYGGHDLRRLSLCEWRGQEGHVCDDRVCGGFPEGVAC